MRKCVLSVEVSKEAPFIFAKIFLKVKVKIQLVSKKCKLVFIKNVKLKEVKERLFLFLFLEKS